MSAYINGITDGRVLSSWLNNCFQRNTGQTRTFTPHVSQAVRNLTVWAGRCR